MLVVATATAGFSTTARPASPCGDVRPLPTASHWTPHGRGWTASTTPDWQIRQIGADHHWLLTFWWGDLGQLWDDWAEGYYTKAILAARERRLPIALTATQWESALYDDRRWKNLPPEKTPLVVTPEGRVLPKVSPFGPVAPWREAGAAWATTPILQHLEELYPDPPYVFLLSNNEAEVLQLNELETDRRYVEAYGRGQSLEVRRKVLGDGIIERKKALVDALRSALTAWKDRAVIAGWTGTAVDFGRYSGTPASRTSWVLESSATSSAPITGRLSIFPFIFDAASLKYYLPDGRGSHDFTLFSPQVEVMSAPLQLDYACRVHPGFRWEMSAWLDPAYVARMQRQGQASFAARYEGLVRWGMWVVRPESVRHFSMSQEKLDSFGLYLDAVMRAVDEIHASPELASFWRQSDLVMNTEVTHPWQVDVPAEYAATPRWVALSTNLDPPRPWTLDTAFRVWALARVQGASGSRRWLLFAQSPRGPEAGVRVTVPGFGLATVDAAPEGRYYLLQEGTPGARPLLGVPSAPVVDQR